MRGAVAAAANAHCRCQALPAIIAPAVPELQVDVQRRTVEAQLRRAAYTAAQLDELPENVGTYRAVGKA